MLLKYLMKEKKINNNDLFNKNYSNLFLKLPFGTPSLKCYYEMYDREYMLINKREKYAIDDFNHLNDLLFQKGKDNLEIYEWSTDWSDYFDDGNEWWGSRCISIYDKLCDRFVIIMLSVTD